MTLGPLMIDLAGTEVQPDEREMLRHPLVGGVLLFARNYSEPQQLSRLVSAIHALRTPALLVAVDHEGGRVQRFREGFSRLPPARRIGQLFDEDRGAGLDAARSMGWLMAAELRAHGVDLSFAPTVDLDYGVNEAIGDRAFHARPEVVAQLAGAWIHGMRDAGMAATAKHFPGHGAVVADSHAALPVDRRQLVDLDDDLTPYRLLIANGLPAVMVAHIQFPAEDAWPSSFSGRWVTGVLRGELRFQGAVFTDDLSMGAAAAGGDILERSRRALAAGCDMLLVCNDRPAALTVLEGLKVDPAPASPLRLVRMRGRDGLTRDELASRPAWQHSQGVLARLAAAPSLSLKAAGE